MQTTAEIAISAGMAVLAVVFYLLGNFTQSVNPDDPGPGFYPRALSLLLLIASLVQIAVSLWKKRKTDKKEETDAGGRHFSYRLFIGTVLLSVLYGFVFDKASYLITTTAFLLGMMLLGGVRKWHVLLGVAVGYSVATYYLFGQVLMVQLK